MATLYEIKATYCDGGSAHVNCNTPEVLGEYHTQVWADPDAAEAARQELQDGIDDTGLDKSTEYHVAEHHVEIPDGWYFLHIDGGGWEGVEFIDEQPRGRIYEANVASHRAARDRFAGIEPSELDTQCDEPLANVITRLVLGNDTFLNMVEVCRMHEATKIGGTWYTDDSEYTATGQTITRGDGSQCTVEGDADAIAKQLASGEISDDQFNWVE